MSATTVIHRVFKRYFSILLCTLMFSSTAVFAELTVTLDSITPSISPRDGSVPPQEGVELFVFPGTSTETQYTAVFNVNEEPGSTVMIAGTIDTYTYDVDADTLTLVITHSGYATGVETPGPPTDFSIVFIGAVLEDGLPAAMKGSWMATNIGPSNWELIPPDEESPAFGYDLSGPEGETGYFKMFIPQTMITFLSEVFDETLTISDLAIFNEDYQASNTVTEVSSGGKTGALVDIFITFEDGELDFPDDDGDDQGDDSLRTLNAQGGYPGSGSETVSKEITVNRALSASLIATDITPVKRESITVYGWIKGASAGETVKITSSIIKAKKVKKGKAALKRYRKKGWKQVTIESEGRFTFPYKARKNDVLKAIYKIKGQPAQKSKRLRIRPTKR